jgi:hypothetical protein
VRINPLLWALEGNQRRNLTVEEVKQQVEEAAAVLKKALPKAELVAVDAHGVQGTAGLIRDSQAGMVKKERFLMRLAPKLHAPVGARRRDLLWREVLDAAADCGLPRESLVVLAALSCVSVPNGRGAARGVLNITRHYSKADAYNALSDLRALELLMTLFATFPDQRLMLCTGDMSLALFWAGIRASDFLWDGKRIQFKVSPVEEMLPTLTPAQEESLFGRLLD